MANGKVGFFAGGVLISGTGLTLLHHFVDPTNLPYFLEVASRNTESLLTAGLAVLTICLATVLWDRSGHQPPSPKPPPITTDGEFKKLLSERALRYVPQAHMTGEDVRILQQALVGKGIPTRIDGDFGLATKSCVEQFQQKEGIPVDGVVDFRTRVALGIAVVRLPSSQIPPAH